MKNLGADDCFVFFSVTLSDSSTLQMPYSIFTAGSYPTLQMRQVSPGRFEKTFIPEVFFNLQPGQQIGNVTTVVIKRTYLTGADRVDANTNIDLFCPE